MGRTALQTALNSPAAATGYTLIDRCGLNIRTFQTISEPLASRADRNKITATILVTAYNKLFVETIRIHTCQVLSQHPLHHFYQDPVRGVL